MDVQLHSFLTLAPDGGEWPASLPGHCRPGKKTSDTHRIGGWVGPRAGQKFEAEINLLLLPRSEPVPSSS